VATAIKICELWTLTPTEPLRFARAVTSWSGGRELSCTADLDGATSAWWPFHLHSSQHTGQHSVHICWYHWRKTVPGKMVLIIYWWWKYKCIISDLFVACSKQKWSGLAWSTSHSSSVRKCYKAQDTAFFVPNECLENLSSLVGLACLLVLPWEQYLWTCGTSLVGTARDEPIVKCARPDQPDCLPWPV